MKVSHVPASPVAPRRPAFGRTVVEFSVETAPVAKAAVGPQRLNKREEIEAAHAAEAKAAAEATAKAKADADAALRAAAEARAKESGFYAVSCSHPGGCSVRLVAAVAYHKGDDARCRAHQTVGFVSWGLKKHREDEQRRLEAEALADLLRPRRR